MGLEAPHVLPNSFLRYPTQLTAGRKGSSIHLPSARGKEPPRPAHRMASQLCCALSRSSRMIRCVSTTTCQSLVYGVVEGLENIRLADCMQNMTRAPKSVECRIHTFRPSKVSYTIPELESYWGHLLRYTFARCRGTWVR